MKDHLFIAIILFIPLLFCGCGTDDRVHLLNVSYDPTREVYHQVNERFVEHWLAKTGEQIVVNQSHGGSGAQSMSVAHGQRADVVTLALAYDIDSISRNTNPPVIAPDWQTRLPNNSCPYTSTIVFLVRKGNPKNIRDWDDLINRDDVQIITPNPKTSGGARWNYLAAWGYVVNRELDGNLALIADAERQSDPQLTAKVARANQIAKAELAKMFNQNKIPVKDNGARTATNTFVKNHIGDVLLAWENEALLYMKNSPDEDIQIVVPSISIVAEPPVALVDRNVDHKGTRAVAEEYLNFLYTPEIQRLAAEFFYRPSDEKVAAEFNSVFPQLKLFRIQEVFGSWTQAQEVLFAADGTFDQMMEQD